MNKCPGQKPGHLFWALDSNLPGAFIQKNPCHFFPSFSLTFAPPKPEGFVHRNKYLKTK